MSDQGWSPEPWCRSNDVIKDFNGGVVVLSPRDWRISIYDLRRIVSCVNALAGISDPAALVESHALLLAVVKGFLKGMDKQDDPHFAKLIAREEAARK